MIVATIRPGSPRAKQWLDVFGSDRVPVRNPLPHRGRFDGVERSFLDVAVETVGRPD